MIFYKGDGIVIGVIICIIMLISVIFSLFSGNISKVCESAANGANDALELSLTLCAVMGLWGGIMRIAEKSRLTDKIALLLSPIICFLFKGIKKGSKAFNAISMNMTANMLGLGNAATPLGIEAVKSLNDDSAHSKRNISMLVVINTASIQLIPTTVAAIRLSKGSAHPYEIIPAVLLTSLVSVTAGCIMTHILYSRGNKDDR